VDSILLEEVRYRIDDDDVGDGDVTNAHQHAEVRNGLEVEQNTCNETVRPSVTSE
jgi:hypothetical protein